MTLELKKQLHKKEKKETLYILFNKKKFSVKGHWTGKKRRGLIVSANSWEEINFFTSNHYSCMVFLYMKNRDYYVMSS